MTRKNEKQGVARRVAEATLDVAVGGTALAADKAIETLSRVADRAEEALGRGRREARRAADGAAERARTAASGRDGRTYEDRTRDELYDLAAERDIEGRSSMDKAELITALRAQQ